MIPLSELTDDPTAKTEDLVKVGDEIDVVVVKPNDAEGTILLSKKRIDADKNWDALVEAEQNGTVLTGKVIELTKGRPCYDQPLRPRLYSDFADHASAPRRAV